MPLMPGNSRGVISHNISEMVKAGHPHNVAVAASLHNAHGFRPPHRAAGGLAPQVFANAPHLDVGGMPSSAEMAPWYVRQDERPVHNAGLLNSAVPGRTDQLNKVVPAGAYIIPADVVSGLGEGNTMAGANVLQKALSLGPHGMPLPHIRGEMGPPRVSPPPAFNESKQPFARGGAPASHVPVVLAGGEYCVHPDDVRRIGNGDIKKGHRILDAFCIHARKKTIKEMSKLKPPKK